jgi:quercetin dioxygenase-like cupin family protein
MAYVLSGHLVVTIEETGLETRYAAGEFVVEMVDTWHHGRNDGTLPLWLLVIDLGPEGQSNTVLQDP